MTPDEILGRKIASALGLKTGGDNLLKTGYGPKTYEGIGALIRNILNDSKKAS